MRNGPGTADLQRWSEEVARDPGSPSFLPLAEAYRRMGKTQAALRLCLRGLERCPGSVDGHLLLARIYLELGERERAADEWAITARLDPDNFDAHRGLGFFHLERGEYASAGRHLERAALVRPGDPAVQEALAVLRRHLARSGAASQTAATANGSEAPVPPPPEARNGAGSSAPAAAAGRAETAAQPGATTQPPAAAAERGEEVAQPPAPPAAAESVETAPQAAAAAQPAAGAATKAERSPAEAAKVPGAGGRDPARVFEPLSREAPFLGALLLDGRGLILAGSVRAGGTTRSEALGAAVGPAAEEAARTAALLSIGRWRGILIETDRALLHVSPLEEDLLLLVATECGTPVGWVLRTAERAAELARRFLAEGVV
ncbi:MAG TPA: tetratricopeptide repeat protein [Longimicrobiales bacterium]